MHHDCEIFGVITSDNDEKIAMNETADEERLCHDLDMADVIGIFDSFDSKFGLCLFTYGPLAQYVFKESFVIPKDSAALWNCMRDTDRAPPQPTFDRLNGILIFASDPSNVVTLFALLL